MFKLVTQTRESVEKSLGKMPTLAQAKERLNSFNQCGADILDLGQLYFPTEGDDEVSKTSGPMACLFKEAPVPTWRGNPKKTLSDWKIVVVTSEFEEDSKTYHVHKSILATGPRSSKYFAKLFLEKGEEGERKSTNEARTTRIELDEQDAESFPLLLDFIYNVGHQRKVSQNDTSLSLVIGDGFTVNNAVSLRHLARVFDCEGLMLAVNKFIQQDLSLKTGPLYLMQAYSYQDRRLVESAKRLCIENFPRLDTNAVLKFPLPLFRSIVCSVMRRAKSTTTTDGESTFSEDENVSSYHLSDVVCQYLEKHPKIATAKLLLELTDKKVMPQIAPEAAIGFTAIARDLDSRDIAPESEEWHGLIILCERCAKAVVNEYGWQDFDVSSALHEYLNGSCALEEGSKMDSLLFATSLAAALEKAQRDLKKSSSDNMVVSKRRPSSNDPDLQRENSELRAKNRGLKKDMERCEDDLEDAKEEIRLLKKQMKELKRKK